MVDNRLKAIPTPAQRFIRRAGLEWFVQGDNEEYFSDEIIAIHPNEKNEWLDAAQRCFDALFSTVRSATRSGEWENLGIPPNARELVAYSINNEMDDFLFGRFDFAGGFGEYPISMLEFNADTCSLVPETVLVQRHLWEEMKHPFGQGPFDPLFDALVDRFEYLLERHPEFEPNLLLSTMGYEEDWLNADILVDAAKKAGFKEVHQVDLSAVIFDPEEGVFVELGNDRYIHFDFWYKMVPWDFIAYEEPELMKILTDLVLDEKLLVLNPAWTMVLQSKASLVHLSKQFAHDPAILKAAYSADAFEDHRYARKPIFGRTGENVALFDGDKYRAVAENDGDYGSMPAIYQDLARFSIDTDGYRYQASVFYTDHPCSLCFRRQDDLIIGDDAEFVPHSLTEHPFDL